MHILHATILVFVYTLRVQAQPRWAAQAQLWGANGACTDETNGCDFSCQVSVNGVWSAWSTHVVNANSPRCAVAHATCLESYSQIRWSNGPVAFAAGESIFTGGATTVSVACVDWLSGSTSRNAGRCVREALHETASHETVVVARRAPCSQQELDGRT
jgi:hypothetical protein